MDGGVCLDLLNKGGSLKKEEGLGQNVIQIPAERADRMTGILDKLGVKYSVKKVWE